MTKEAEALVKVAKRLGERGAHVVVPVRWLNKKVILVCTNPVRKKYPLDSTR